MSNSTTDISPLDIDLTCSNATHPFVTSESPTWYRVLAALYSAGFILFIFTSLRALYRRKSYFPVVRARKPMLVAVSASGALVHLIVGPIRDTIGREVFPCMLFIPLWFMFLPLVCLPSLVRIFFYLNRVQMEKIKALHVKEKLHHADSETWAAWTQLDGHISAEPMLDDDQDDEEGEDVMKLSEPILNLGDQVLSGSEPKNTNSGRLQRRMSGIKAIQALKKPLESAYLRRFELKKRLTRTRIGVMVVAASLIPFLSVSLYSTNSSLFRHHCVGCDYSDSQVQTWFVFLAVLCVWSIASLFQLRNVKDMAGLKKEMAIVFTILLIGGIIWFVLFTVDPKDLEQDGYLSWSLFLSLTLGLVHYLQCVLPTQATYESNVLLEIAYGRRPKKDVRTWDLSTFQERSSMEIIGSPSPMASPSIALTPMTSSRVRMLIDSVPFSLDEIMNNDSEIVEENNKEQASEENYIDVVVVDNTNSKRVQQSEASRSGRYNTKASIQNTEANDNMSASEFFTESVGKPAQTPRRPRATTHKTNFSGRTAVSSLKHDSMLSMVLRNDPLRALFMEHLSSELSSENLLFWEEVQFWKSQFRNLGQTAASAEPTALRASQYKMFKRAKALYRTFVRKNSPLQVNLSSENMRELDGVLDGEARVIKLRVFDRAVREIEHVMQSDGLARFAKTVDLSKFLRDCCSVEI